MANKKRITAVAISALAVLVVGAWLAWVVTYNRRIKALDLVPAEYYPMNTFVELGDNYCYGNYYDGLSICANDYRIIDTDAYLEEKGLSEDDFDYLTDKICIVDLTVRYRATEAQKKEAQSPGEPYMDVNMGDFFMCGQDYYEVQNTDLYLVENPTELETTGIRFHDGDDCNVKLVFNLDKRFYTGYSWKHIEDLPRMIYLTGTPVQKNGSADHVRASGGLRIRTPESGFAAVRFTQKRTCPQSGTACPFFTLRPPNGRCQQLFRVC